MIYTTQRGESFDLERFFPRRNAISSRSCSSGKIWLPVSMNSDLKSGRPWAKAGSDSGPVQASRNLESITRDFEAQVALRIADGNRGRGEGELIKHRGPQIPCKCWPHRLPPLVRGGGGKGINEASSGFYPTPALPHQGGEEPHTLKTILDDMPGTPGLAPGLYIPSGRITVKTWLGLLLTIMAFMAGCARGYARQNPGRNSTYQDTGIWHQNNETGMPSGIIGYGVERSALTAWLAMFCPRTGKSEAGRASPPSGGAAHPAPGPRRDAVPPHSA